MSVESGLASFFRVGASARGVRLRISGDPSGTPSLLCFPCAGGTSSVFRPLAARLPPSWRIAAVDPPGHGLHDGEALDRVEQLVELYAEVLEGELSRRPYLAGHSLGGLIAYLLALDAQARGTPPAGVVLFAARAPGQTLWERWSRLSDEALIERLEAIGGIPDPLRDDRESIRRYLPGVRADFRALEHWYIGRSLPSLSCPLWIAAARDDAFLPVERVRDWTAQSGRSELAVLPGDHFFVQQRPDEVAAWLVKTLV